MPKTKKADLRGKSEWREYFKGNRKKINPIQRTRVLQYVKERAKKNMEDLVLISKGLHYLTDNISKEKAEKHRQEIFLMPLTVQSFFRLWLESKKRARDIEDDFHEHGEEIVFDVRGFRIDQLKMKRLSS